VILGDHHDTTLSELKCACMCTVCCADCLSFPHLIHAILSLTSGVVFFVVAILLVGVLKSVLARPQRHSHSWPHNSTARADAATVPLQLQQGPHGVP
jgi:hypothetical protein